MTPTTTTLRLDTESFRFQQARAGRRATEADGAFETRFVDDEGESARVPSRRSPVPASAIPAATARAEWLAFDGAWTMEDDAAGAGRTGCGLAWLEQALDGVLPSPLGTLLQLFVCVSLALALISAVLPMIDRL